jgi:hypothetical protein
MFTLWRGISVASSASDLAMFRRAAALAGIILLLTMLVTLVAAVHLHRARTTIYVGGNVEHVAIRVA